MRLTTLTSLSSDSQRYPFGMVMQGRNWSVGSSEEYRFGFNGKENDDAVKGDDNSLDFGARIYDPRIGRWSSVDPLQGKYPTLTPYNFSGNNPIALVDFDGEDFGVIINNGANPSITFVANVYTISEKTYRQAVRSAKRWNSKKNTVDGYAIAFQINVIPPPIVSDADVVNSFPNQVFYKKNGKVRSARMESYRLILARSIVEQKANNDKIGNVYAGSSGWHSESVSGESYDGGYTANGKYISMNSHNLNGDLGEIEDLVTHEFGHLFGLDDPGGEYYSSGGIMEYQGIKLNPISDADVLDILRFAKEYLANPADVKFKYNPKVIILENKGYSDGQNPLGVEGEYIPSGCQ